jgi:hypothetical protein
MDDFIIITLSTEDFIIIIIIMHEIISSYFSL